LADWRPGDFVGSIFVIGLTFVEPDGSERFESYVGTVKEFDVDNGEFEDLDDGSDSAALIIECHDGQVRTFPFQSDTIEVAESGIYELPDGTTVEDQDYEMHWRITPPTRN